MSEPNFALESALSRLQAVSKVKDDPHVSVRILPYMAVALLADRDSLQRDLQSTREETERACRALENMGAALTDAQNSEAALEQQLSAAREEVERLKGQLPEGMKDCTIQFKECEKGHGRLTAANWVQYGCHHCKIQALSAASEAREAALREADREIEEAITERDQNAEQADELAACIEGLLGVEIGEHSNMNAPWQNAIDAAQHELDKRSRKADAALRPEGAA